MNCGEHTIDYRCPKCNQDKCLGLVVIDSPTPIRDTSPCDAAIIKECPVCFSKFWHHVIREVLAFKPEQYGLINPKDFKESF